MRARELGDQSLGKPSQDVRIFRSENLEASCPCAYCVGMPRIEQALDGFFRDPAKAHDLAQLDGPIRQVGGALAMLGHFSAASSLKECGSRIQQFAQPGSLPASEEFEWVANQLSLLGFFVDALQNGETDFEIFVRRMKGEKPAAVAAGTDAAIEAAAEAEGIAAPSVETQLAQHARDTQTLMAALHEAPEDVGLQDELKQNLQTIQKDADLVANVELGETAKAALKALQAGESADAALAGFKPQGQETQQPSAATLQLAESTHEEIDAELLGIFLEEATEVLAALDEQLNLLAADTVTDKVFDKLMAKAARTTKEADYLAVYSRAAELGEEFGKT